MVKLHFCPHICSIFQSFQLRSDKWMNSSMKLLFGLISCQLWTNFGAKHPIYKQKHCCQALLTAGMSDSFHFTSHTHSLTTKWWGPRLLQCKVQSRLLSHSLRKQTTNSLKENKHNFNNLCCCCCNESTAAVKIYSSQGTWKGTKLSHVSFTSS